MKDKLKTKEISITIVFAALYALGVIFLAPISFGIYQVRVAERVFSRLKEVIDNFFARNRGLYEKVIAFFVPESDELKLVREYSDFLVLDYSPEVEVSYNNNTSEVYCNPNVWGDFEKVLRKFGLLKG